MAKMRLDVLLTNRKLADTRSKAQALIMAGKVRVNGQVTTKAGTQVSASAEVSVERDLPFVSRGGIKLAAALDVFKVDPSGLICADVGASTGGFTDVLLQRDAAYVYAIDVGYGQLAWKLRQDHRVTVMERTNARYLTTLPQPISLVTVDVSFISLKLILPVVVKWLDSSAEIVALVKPQFEAGKEHVGKGGVIRDESVHSQVLHETAGFATDLNLSVLGVAASPITGPAGNHEFFIYAGWNVKRMSIDIDGAISSCLSELHPSG